MKKIILFLVCMLSGFMFSHTLNYNKIVLRHWSIQKNNTFIDGSFSKFKNGLVSIEDAQNRIIDVPLQSLSAEDQSYVKNREDAIIAINTSLSTVNKAENVTPFLIKSILIALFLFVFGIYIFRNIESKKRNYLIPIVSAGIVMTLFSFGKKMLTTTDPNFINSAFIPFIPNVHTSWDSNYFYVESKGIPNHTMMVGISNHGWQQQVPNPQCYIGTNHWSIPLNPIIAATPTLIDNVHFT